MKQVRGLLEEAEIRIDSKKKCTSNFFYFCTRTLPLLPCLIMQLVGQKQLRVISVTNESLVTSKFITLELKITLLSLPLEAVITRLISDLFV